MDLVSKRAPASETDLGFSEKVKLNNGKWGYRKMVSLTEYRVSGMTGGHGYRRPKASHA